MWNSGLLSISIYSPVWETFPVSDSGLHGWKPKPTGQTTQSWPGTWLGFDRRPAPYPCRIKALGSSDLTWKHLQLPASHTSSSTKHFLRGAWRAGRRSDFSENKDERLRARTGRRNPGECWDPNHSPLLSFIRLFPVWSNQSSISWCLSPSPVLEQPCLALPLSWLHQHPHGWLSSRWQWHRDEQGFAHQVLLCELTQTSPSFCEVQRGKFSNCLMPQGHQSSLKGQEHGKATLMQPAWKRCRRD